MPSQVDGSYQERVAGSREVNEALAAVESFVQLTSLGKRLYEVGSSCQRKRAHVLMNVGSSVLPVTGWSPQIS